MEPWGTLARALAEDEADALAPALERLHAQGRARWPALPIPPADFVAHLALHLPPEERVEHVQTILADDFYLACACALAVPGAAEALDAAYIAKVPLYVSHVDGSPAFADEMRQQVRERLLVATDERRARIGDYSGRGSLAGWLRVIAVRLALNHVASPHQARRVDDVAALDELAADASAELQVLRRQHSEAVADALRRALGTLEPKQRVILRMYFVTGQSTDAIAAVLRVNRSTAARRLVAARRAVYDETKRILQERFPLSTGELTSVVRALRAQLDFSMTSILGAPDE